MRENFFSPDPALLQQRDDLLEHEAGDPVAAGSASRRHVGRRVHNRMRDCRRAWREFEAPPLLPADGSSLEGANRAPRQTSFGTIWEAPL
jgi:hypothetical protein